ncbi:hypothetical protein MUK42_37046 [Musa troglodytarum]|uniref:Uncharacterized protein n=1 Tax=Musa troglodytarum TaxID=320322 RepID=A0A9E7GMN3_9LILI|nr:hypothetical protein MUK42_37046 [Musa troglodytarum]
MGSTSIILLLSIINHRNMYLRLPFLKVLKRSPLISRSSPSTYYYLSKQACIHRGSSPAIDATNPWLLLRACTDRASLLSRRRVHHFRKGSAPIQERMLAR